MFDIGWPELMVVAIVLIVVVGPKDLPRMLRTFGKTTTKLRSMAGDFRRQFDDALKEAELDDVKSTIDTARSLDPTREIRKQLNPLGKIGDDIKDSLKTATKPAAAAEKTEKPPVEQKSQPPQAKSEPKPAAKTKSSSGKTKPAAGGKARAKTAKTVDAGKSS